MKKKSLALIGLAAFLVMGCSKSSSNKEQEEVKASITIAPTETTIPGEQVEDQLEEENVNIDKVPSMDFVKELEIGWNLGNTLDATGGIGVMSENAWGNPVTKKDMILDIKEAGFNVIRIPVTWDGHLTADGNYTIHDKWLERVKEVVDYAYEEDMYVILNMHHEEWIFPSYENQEAAIKQLIAVWTQIANFFQEYDEHLIFEGMNEPRMIGTPNEWNGGNQEGHEVVNALGQAFVETVRSTGGNNLYRQLMVPGYAASSSYNALKAIQLPKDDYLILSVHAYLPYLMALDGGATSTFDANNSNDTKDIDSLMLTLNDLFISKGIPVIIGEFGSRNKENLAERVELAEYFVKAAHAYNIPCVWWDNNAFSGSGENFGLYERRERKWIYKEIVKAMLKGLEDK